MSFDTVFWKQKRRISAKPDAIYAALCRGKTVPEIEKLPVDEILEALKKEFAAFDPKKKEPTIEVGNGGVEVTWSDRHFRLDHAAGMTEPVGSIWRIMRDFGCVMYCSAGNKLYRGKERTPFDADVLTRHAKRMQRINTRLDDLVAAADELEAAERLLNDPMKASKLANAAWKRQWPRCKSHAESYRHAECFRRVAKEVREYAERHAAGESRKPRGTSNPQRCTHKTRSRCSQGKTKVKDKS